MTERKALEPCPFCRSKSVGPEQWPLNIHYVVCLECLAKGPTDNASEKEAIAAWNAHTILAAPAPVAAGEGMVMVPRVKLKTMWDVFDDAARLRDDVANALAASPAQSPVSEGAEIERLREKLVGPVRAVHQYRAVVIDALGRDDEAVRCAEQAFDKLHAAIAALTNGGDNA